MKNLLIYLLFVVLPLASAQPAAPLYAKSLIENGYVLSEVYDSRQIWQYRDEKMVYFYVTNNKTGDDDSMDLKRGAVEQSGGFAIEAYSRPNSNSIDCKENSNEQLRHLIDKCGGNMILRSLTDAERAQIRQYKDEQKVSKKPFEVTFDRKRLMTKSAGIAQLSLDQFQEPTGWSDYYNLLFTARLNSGNENPHEVALKDKLSDKSFVIEGLPAESKEECGKDGLEDLNMIFCEGKIKVVPYRA